MLEIIDSGVQPAKENMQKDAELLENLRDKAILHLYEWEKPSVSYGYFVPIEKYFFMAKAEELGIDFCKRPTGGGIVFHLWDYAFSFLLPANSPFFSENTLENYAFVNGIVQKALENYFDEKFSIVNKSKFDKEDHRNFFCMAKPTKYDLTIGSKKVVGAAQRRKKQGYLHQGTIALAAPEEKYLELLRFDEVKKAIEKVSFILPGEESLQEKRNRLKNFLSEQFIKTIMP